MSAKVRKPTFFLVGAPKSGTTAMCTYLRAHPNVFIPEEKEPGFFLDHAPAHPRHLTAQAYLDLFSPATAQHYALGEGTVWYLMFPDALHRIREFNPDAKIIAMLRNPVDLVVSLHSHFVMDFREDMEDLESAWDMRGCRRKRLREPLDRVDRATLQYREIGRLGTQCENVLHIFPRHQVKFLLYDDFSSNPRSEYEGILTFLGVSPDGRTDFPRINVRRRNRIEWLARFMQQPPCWLAALHGAAKRAFGIRKTGLKELLQKPVQATVPLREEFRCRLVEFFRDEIERLSRLLEKDLGHWLD